MSRIPLLSYEDLPPGDRPAIDGFVKSGGVLTNMKEALLYSDVAFRSYLEWYALWNEIQQFIGLRGAEIFAFAISAETDCLLCSTYFRKALVDRGEDPEHLKLDPRDDVLAAFGRQLGKDPNGVTDALFAYLKKYFSDREIVLLTAFGGFMIAHNVFNSALRIDLDDYLVNFKK